MIHPKLQQRILTSRQLGADESLVLAGGGNTSVKIELDGLPCMFIKASGCDMANIDVDGFTPLKLSALEKYQQTQNLADAEMMQVLRAARLHASDPEPSVESLLHAWIPYCFIDHGHADEVLTVFASSSSDQQARQLCAALYGQQVVWLPFFASGFPLAKACLAALPLPPTQLRGMILHHHGLLAFGATAEECAQNHQWMVAQATRLLARNKAPEWQPCLAEPKQRQEEVLMQLEKQVSKSGQWQALLVDPRFFKLSDAQQRAASAALTPGHVLHLGPFPLWLNRGQKLAEAVAAYRQQYQSWSQKFSKQPAASSWSWPRTVLDPENKIAFAFGRDAEHAQLVARILQHNLAAKLRGSVLGPWYGASEEVVFAAENSMLERLKLERNFGGQSNSADK